MRRFCSVCGAESFPEKNISLHKIPEEDWADWRKYFKCKLPHKGVVCSQHIPEDCKIYFKNRTIVKKQMFTHIIKTTSAKAKDISATNASIRESPKKIPDAPTLLNSQVIQMDDGDDDEVTFVKVEPNLNFEEEMEDEGDVEANLVPTGTNAVFLNEQSNRMVHTINMKIPATSSGQTFRLKRGAARFKIKIVKKKLTKKDVCEMFDFRTTNSYRTANANLDAIAGISLPFFSKLVKATRSDFDSFKKLDSKDRLLLFLIKMKWGINFQVLSPMFQVNTAIAARTFFDTLGLLVEKTKGWLSETLRESVPETLPWSKYKVIDFVEIITESPQDQMPSKAMLSRTKRYTFQFLMGMESSGAIFHVSKARHGGFRSENIVNGFDFLDFMNFVRPGDVVATRRLFPAFRKAVEKRGATLVSLACRDTCAGQDDKCFQIASLRRKYEKTLRRLRSFAILGQVSLPLFGNIDKIMYVGCVLTNQAV